MAQAVKNPPANAGDIRDTGSIPGLGRFPGEGYGSPLQYFCLENYTDGGAWRATVPKATKSRTRLSESHTRVGGYLCRRKNDMYARDSNASDNWMKWPWDSEGDSWLPAGEWPPEEVAFANSRTGG